MPDRADILTQQIDAQLETSPQAAADHLRRLIFTAPSPYMAQELVNKVEMSQDPQGAGQMVEYHPMPGQTDIAIASVDPMSGQPVQDFVATLQTPGWNGYGPMVGMNGMFVFGNGYGMRFDFDRGRLGDCMQFENNYLNIGFRFGGGSMPGWNHLQRTPYQIPQPIVQNITNNYNTHNTTNNTINNTVNNQPGRRPIAHPILTTPGTEGSTLSPGAPSTGFHINPQGSTSQTDGEAGYPRRNRSTVPPAGSEGVNTAPQASVNTHRPTLGSVTGQTERAPQIRVAPSSEAQTTPAPKTHLYVPHDNTEKKK